MKRLIKYTNSRNQTIVLNQYPFYTDLSDLRDWRWSYNTENHLISNFERDMIDRKLNISIVNESLSARETLFNIFEVDTVAGVDGTLQLGDWELGCRVVENSKVNAPDLDYKFELKIVSEYPAWKRKTLYSFDTAKFSERETENRGRDYPRFYPWEYAKPNATSTNIIITNPGGAGFTLRFYGAINNPIIYINNNPYQVNVNVGASQQLLITAIGKKKTIELISSSGTKTNEFAKRNKDFSIFTPLIYGTNVISYQSGIKFDLTVIEERSEPIWK